MIKDSSMNSPDVKALNGSELLADPSYAGFQLKDGVEMGDYQIDIDYGYPRAGNIPNNTEDTQGNSGWTPAGAEHPKSATSGRNYIKPTKNADPDAEKAVK